MSRYQGLPNPRQARSRSCVDDMAPLHGGVLTASPWQASSWALPSGWYTAAIVAVDTSGNQSDPIYIRSELLRNTWGLHRLVYVDQPKVTGWAALSGLVQQDDGSLVSVDHVAGMT